MAHGDRARNSAGNKLSPGSGPISEDYTWTVLYWGCRSQGLEGRKGQDAANSKQLPMFYGHCRRRPQTGDPENTNLGSLCPRLSQMTTSYDHFMQMF